MSGSHSKEESDRFAADSITVKKLIKATKSYIERLDAKIYKELPEREKILDKIYGPNSKIPQKERAKLYKKEVAKFDKKNGYEQERNEAKKLLSTLEPEPSMRKAPSDALKIFDFKLALQRWDQRTFWQRMFGRKDKDKRTFTSTISEAFEQHKKFGNVYEKAPSKPRALATDEQIAAALQRTEQDKSKMTPGKRK